MTLVLSQKSYGQRVEKSGRQAREMVEYLDESSNAMGVLLNKISSFVADFREGMEGFKIPLEGFYTGLLARERDFARIDGKVSKLADTVYAHVMESLKQLDRPSLSQVQRQLEYHGFSPVSIASSEEALRYARQWLTGEAEKLKRRIDVFQEKKREADLCLRTGFQSYEDAKQGTASFWDRFWGKKPVCYPQTTDASEPYQLVRPRLPLLRKAIHRPLETFLPGDQTILSALSILCSKKSTYDIRRIMNARSYSQGSFENLDRRLEASSCELASREDLEPFDFFIPESPIDSLEILEDSSMDIYCESLDAVDILSQEEALFTPASYSSSESIDSLVHLFPSRECPSSCQAPKHVSVAVQKFRLGLSSRYFPYFSYVQEASQFEKELKTIQQDFLSKLEKMVAAQAELVQLKQNNQSDSSRFVSFEKLVNESVVGYNRWLHKLGKFENVESRICHIHESFLNKKIDEESLATLHGLRFPIEDIQAFHRFVENLGSLKLSIEATHKEMNSFEDHLSARLDDMCYFIEAYQGKTGYVGGILNWTIWGRSYLKEKLSALQKEEWERDPSLKVAFLQSIERRLAF